MRRRFARTPELARAMWRPIAKRCGIDISEQNPSYPMVPDLLQLSVGHVKRLTFFRCSGLWPTTGRRQQARREAAFAAERRVEQDADETPRSVSLIDALAEMSAGLRSWRTSYLLALQDIQLRYKRSLLGPFWISAALLATILALAYVLAPVFQTDFVSYISFIGTGLLAWNLIVALINESCTSVTEHTELLQNVRLPLSVIAGRIAIRNSIVFAHNLIAVILLLLIFGERFSVVALLAAPGALTILVFGYLLVMAMGPLCARYRDIPLVIQNVMQVIFFLTPIFWMPNPSSHRPMLTAPNPFYHLIELVRAPLRGEQATWFDWQIALWSCAVVGLLAIVSISMTRKRLNLWL